VLADADKIRRLHLRYWFKAFPPTAWMEVPLSSLSETGTGVGAWIFSDLL